MKSISEIIDLNAFKSSKEGQEPRQKVDPICRWLVNEIFLKMAIICRGFDSVFPTHKIIEVEKDIWTRALMKRGIKTERQIEPGMFKLEEYIYPKPPSLSQFLQWCQNSTSLGLPSIDEAYLMALKLNRQFSDYVPACDKAYTVVRHVLDQIGRMEFREMTVEQAKKTFAYYYNISSQQFAAGKLEIIHKALPEKVELRPEDRARSDAARVKAMDEVRRMLRPQS